MSVADDRSEAGKALNRVRWHGVVVSRAAQTVIERRDELDEEQRAEVVAALTEREDGDDE